MFTLNFSSISNGSLTHFGKKFKKICPQTMPTKLDASQTGDDADENGL